jgi:hypothetical protein
LLRRRSFITAARVPESRACSELHDGEKRTKNQLESFARDGPLRLIPKGLQHSAQGCEFILVSLS